MFERFTESARRVIVLAQEEARALRSPEIRGVHLLLGLLGEEGGQGAAALRECGLDLTTTREAVGKVSPTLSEPRAGQIPFTPNGKKILEWTLREALSLGHNYISTEHLLLAILAKDDGTCDAVFSLVGVRPDRVLDAILDMLNVEPSGRAPRRQVLAQRLAATPAPPAQESGEEEAEQPEELEAIEAIPTHLDRPALEDDLGRSRLAQVLAERIRRVRGENTEAPCGTWRQRRRKRLTDASAARSAGSFMVHIHGPWGAGKSSLLNFLAADLRNRVESADRRFHARLGSFVRLRRPSHPQLSQWIVVHFNAWEHQRLTPPWWWLLVAIQRSCGKELWRINRGRWLTFQLRDFGWRLWNVRAALLTVGLIAAVLGTGLATDWLGVEVHSLNALQTALLTAGTGITLGTALFGMAVGAGRWLAIGTAAGADRFLRRAHDPLGVYRRRFRWLVRSSKRPIVVFIDDLDRCRPEYVVELLEGIQTLFADEPVAYVVAADRTWLCQSFSDGYRQFEGEVGGLGRPLGFLFLEKTFQISTEIPPMSSQDRERYWAMLLRGGEREMPEPQLLGTVPAQRAFANTSTQEEVEDRIGSLITSGVDGEEVLAAAMRRLNAPDMQEQLEKLLAEFAPLLENNPRSMKRLMNAYGIQRDRLLRDGRLLSKQERRQLVLLTILQLRWPALAEHLRRCPSDSGLCSGKSRVPDDHPFGPLFSEPELRSLFDGSVVEERLNAKLIAQFPVDRA